MSRNFTIPDLLDEKGRAVANATCKAFRIDTHVLVETQTTDADGAATFTALPDGVDCVIFALWGIKTEVIPAPHYGVSKLETGVISTADITLKGARLILQDSAGNHSGNLYVDTNGVLHIDAWGNTHSKSISPVSDLGYNLGSASLRWLELNVKQIIVGDALGGGVYADPAGQGLGSTTYYWGTICGQVVALAETTTPSAVDSWGKIYTKSDNELYFQDGAGTEHTLATGENFQVYKASDETVNNQIAQQTDNDLVITLGADEYWELTWKLYLTQGNDANADFDYSVLSTTAASLIYSDTHYLATGTSGVSALATSSNTEINVDTAANDSGLVVIHCLVKAGASGSSVTLRWAQEVAAAVDTTVKAGSCLIGHKLS